MSDQWNSWNLNGSTSAEGGQLVACPPIWPGTQGLNRRSHIFFIFSWCFLPRTWSSICAHPLIHISHTRHGRGRFQSGSGSMMTARSSVGGGGMSCWRTARNVVVGHGMFDMVRSMNCSMPLGLSRNVVCRHTGIKTCMMHKHMVYVQMHKHMVYVQMHRHRFVRKETQKRDMYDGTGIFDPRRVCVDTNIGDKHLFVVPCRCLSSPHTDKAWRMLVDYLFAVQVCLVGGQPERGALVE